MAIKKELFGQTKEGKDVYSYTITNKSGASICVLDYGAILQSVKVPDKKGVLRDVVLGYDNVASYEDNPSYFGAIIGRSGNRIKGASFTIDGITYQMEANENGTNNIHSGNNGFEKKIWQVADTSEDTVTFTLTSPEGDHGFPGTFIVSVSYTFTDNQELKIHYHGSSDADTVANMTNHSYFNLNGHNAGRIEGHTLWIDADAFVPVVDNTLIPTGEIASVANTPMDFTKEHTIGARIQEPFEQLIFAGGYDHTYVLGHEKGKIKLFAKAVGDQSGIEMNCYTDLPGVQFYAGNFISGPMGKGETSYQPRDGFCLETQYFPNSINQPNFPSPILKKGEIYDTTTIYQFI